MRPSAGGWHGVGTVAAVRPLHLRTRPDAGDHTRDHRRPRDRPDDRLPAQSRIGGVRGALCSVRSGAPSMDRAASLQMHASARDPLEALQDTFVRLSLRRFVPPGGARRRRRLGRGRSPRTSCGGRGAVQLRRALLRAPAPSTPRGSPLVSAACAADAEDSAGGGRLRPAPRALRGGLRPAQGAGPTGAPDGRPTRGCRLRGGRSPARRRPLEHEDDRVPRAPQRLRAQLSRTLCTRSRRPRPPRSRCA